MLSEKDKKRKDVEKAEKVLEELLNAEVEMELEPELEPEPKTVSTDNQLNIDDENIEDESDEDVDPAAGTGLKAHLAAKEAQKKRVEALEKTDEEQEEKEEQEAVELIYEGVEYVRNTDTNEVYDPNDYEIMGKYIEATEHEDEYIEWADEVAETR